MENETTVNDNSTVNVTRRTKLDSARERLPQATESINATVAELASRFDTNELDVLSQHVAFEVRTRRTTAAEAIKGTNPLKVGDTVVVLHGPHDLVGRTGTVDEVKRVRCYVVVGDRKHYLFSSDVQVVQDPSSQETSSEEEVAPETVLDAASNA